jgi:N-acetylmuramoyl-L-alanine amidase
MTRTGDTFPSLDERAAIAERNKADFFVSIHTNSIKKREIHGALFLIHRSVPSTSTSARTALKLNQVFQRHGIQTRGIDRRNPHVLREHSRPGVLIECGFMTNYTEARKLNTPSYRQQLAEVIAEGLAEALGR